jgi:hypothetical protein
MYLVAFVCFAASAVCAVVVRILPPGMAEDLLRACALGAAIGGLATLFLSLAQTLAPLEPEQASKRGVDAAGDHRPPGRKAV